MADRDPSGIAPTRVGSTETTVLLAVLATPAPRTIRAVARKANVALGHTHLQLTKLRDAGLVAWDEGKAGTLRPLVEVVR